MDLAQRLREDYSRMRMPSRGLDQGGFLCTYYGGGRNTYCKKKHEHIRNNLILYNLILSFRRRFLVGFPMQILKNPKVNEGKHLVETWEKVLVTSGYTDYIKHMKI